MPNVIVSTDIYLLILYFRLNTIMLRIMFAIKEPCLQKKKELVLRDELYLRFLNDKN